MRDRIDELIDGIIVDAYGDYEQLSSFRQAFEDDARFPFRARVVGAEVTVTAVDFDGDERRGLVAVCVRSGERYTVSLLDVVPTGPLSMETRQLVDAYRRCAGADPLATVEFDATDTWVYPRLSTVRFDLPAPLTLHPMGDWDPTKQHWAGPEGPDHSLWRAVLAAGVRPCFEMEQVVPGADVEDWDTDPIVEAAELHRAGHHRDATRLLHDQLAVDVRCVDAWAHLGMIAFDTRGPGAAFEFYETGVAIAEASLPDGFGGVLPWTMVDNRPFLRCLHGLGLCAWRQRRWEDAEAIFTARLWIDPHGGAFDALACLEPIQARARWTKD